MICMKVEDRFNDSGAELSFGFPDCTPVPQGPQISVLSDLSDWSDKSDRHNGDFTAAGYTIVARAVRRFCGWITVSAEWFRRAAVRVLEFCRVVFSAEALFNRNVFARQGGLRL